MRHRLHIDVLHSFRRIQTIADYTFVSTTPPAFHIKHALYQVLLSLNSYIIGRMATTKCHAVRDGMQKDTTEYIVDIMHIVPYSGGKNFIHFKFRQHPIFARFNTTILDPVALKLPVLTPKLHAGPLF